MIVAGKGQRTIRIRWVRSGIGFSRRQKEMVRSLGLRRLHQVVERPDTPPIRGLIARIPQLVEVVDRESRPAWPSTPEYTIIPPEAVPAAATSERVVAEAAAEKPSTDFVEAEKAPAEESPDRQAKKPAAEAAKPEKPTKRAAASKGKAEKPAEAKKKEKAAAKPAKPAQKGKK